VAISVIQLVVGQTQVDIDAKKRQTWAGAHGRPLR
jgi:hypothetical protein